MIRKLVKINPLTGDYAEVDKVRLKRETKDLLNYIKKHVDPNADEHEIWKWVVPLCESVLNETVDLPIKFSELPLQHAIQEGLLPKAFSELYSSFAITISGMAREILDNVDVNGVTYTYADFEA